MSCILVTCVVFGTENTANLLNLIKNNTAFKLKLFIVTDVSNYINLVHHQCIKSDMKFKNSIKFTSLSVSAVIANENGIYYVKPK